VGAAGTPSGFVIAPLDSTRVLVANGGLTEIVNGSSAFLNPPLAANRVAIASYQGAFVADPSFTDVADKGSSTYDPDTIYVASSNSVAVTKDHGLQWRIRFGSATTISDLVVDPANRDTAYVTIGGYSNSGKGFMTTDAFRTVH